MSLQGSPLDIAGAACACLWRCGLKWFLQKNRTDDLSYFTVRRLHETCLSIQRKRTRKKQNR